MWVYLASLRASGDGFHEHWNPFYDPNKHMAGPLLPPAAALAPTLWPQFHLRWSCPSEARAGELESLVRTLNRRYAESSKVFIVILSPSVSGLACLHLIIFQSSSSGKEQGRGDSQRTKKHSGAADSRDREGEAAQ